MIELTQEIVRELLDYDPETGHLFWRERDIKWFNHCKRRPEWARNMWNYKNANKMAFTAQRPEGYHLGRIFDTMYKAHRIIWLYMTGEWPDQVDHENGVPSDNRWKNLRNVTNQENNRNQSLRSTNTSGVTGITRNLGKWQAKIMVDGRNISLGYFSSKDDATKARKTAEEYYGFHKNHGRPKSI